MVEEVDLLLMGARVIDPETGVDGVRNVGIRGGKVVSIEHGEAPTPAAAENVDCSGLVLAPGFIDLHCHAQTVNGMRLRALDGVTTALDLEEGAMPVAATYAVVEEQGRPINFGYSSNWLLARLAEADGISLEPDGNSRRSAPAVAGDAEVKGLTGWQQTGAPETVDKIVERVTQGVREGGIGMGVLLGYAPGCGHVEMLKMARRAAELGVPMFVHGRYRKKDDPLSAVEGLLELLALAASTGAHVHLCHINSTYAAADDLNLVLDAISTAQANGVNITTEAYPYHAGSTAIGAASLSPDDMSAQGQPASLITYLKTGERVADYARLAQLRAEDPGGTAIVDHFDPDDAEDMSRLHRAVTFPGTVVASDAMQLEADGRLTGDKVQLEWPLSEDVFAHPRTAGCFARVIGHISRELGLMSLNEAISRCTYVPATILENCVPAMKRKGRVQVGADADITVFDATAIIDQATFSKLKPSKGIHHVLVGGEFVVRDTRLRPEVSPGKPVRAELD